MLILKGYQERACDALAMYLRHCSRLGDAALAYRRTTEELWGYPLEYRNVADLPGLPYVCLRIPTGGGKTLVACHAAGIARRELMQSSPCVVLWLVPSNPIREQTLRGLRDRSHPYRRALERNVGRVEVVGVEEALGLGRGVYEGSTVVIVATIQAFRRDSTSELNVYKDSGALMDHFGGVELLPADTFQKLEKFEGGGPKRSFANVLCLRRPVVIVDEAHNVRTELSFSTLARFNPSCIVEFSATPKIEADGTETDNPPSNVLHSVSAAELDHDSMIKMPIRLTTRPAWAELLADAVRTRDNLEELAKREYNASGEYIRPIALVQAQKKNQGPDPVIAEKVKEHLIRDHRIPADQVAIATGKTDEIGDLDLSSPACPVRYIVTVDKLREGWDCPFAYVLATLRELKSGTAVEQILGRIMRLPGARRKSVPELNRAYAFSVSDLNEALGHLTRSLVNIGFERQEAKELIVAAASGAVGAPGFFDSEPAQDIRSVAVALPDPLPCEKLSEVARRAIDYDEASQTITLTTPMPEGVREELTAVAVASSRTAVLQAWNQSQKLSGRRVSAAERRVAFDVPLLSYRLDDMLEPFEQTHFLDQPWSLRDCDTPLAEAEFPGAAPTGGSGEIGVSEQGRLRSRFMSDLQEMIVRQSAAGVWNEARLADWLDRSFFHHDIGREESGNFILQVILGLTRDRGFRIEDLVWRKLELSAAIQAKIDGHRRAAHRQSYQLLLLPDSPLAVDPECCFSYARAPFSYGTSHPYRGGRMFQKHYYPNVYDLSEKGEEFDCACFLDSSPEVAHWVRNIPKRPDESFWLQTSTDRFYPDFVCKLTDGRILVVEFKGEHLWTAEDAREKRAVGELWAERSGGRCLFIMPRGADWNAIRSLIG